MAVEIADIDNKIKPLIEAIVQRFEVLVNNIGILPQLNAGIVERNNLVEAINELFVKFSRLNSLIGNLEELEDESSLLDTLNEISEDIITIKEQIGNINVPMLSEAVGGLSEDINEFRNLIGRLGDLETTERDTIVDAINELVQSIRTLTNSGNALAAKVDNKVSYNKDDEMEVAEMLRARQNIGAVGSTEVQRLIDRIPDVEADNNKVSYNKDDEMEVAEMLRARENIGAISADDIPAVEADDNKVSYNQADSGKSPEEKLQARGNIDAVSSGEVQTLIDNIEIPTVGEDTDKVSYDKEDAGKSPEEKQQARNNIGAISADDIPSMESNSNKVSYNQDDGKEPAEMLRARRKY